MSSRFSEMSKEFKRKVIDLVEGRKMFLAVSFAIVVLLVAVCVAVTTLKKPEPQSTKGHEVIDVPGQRKNHGPWTKPGSLEIDWESIRSMSEYPFSLFPDGKSVDAPVRGQLQVKLDTGLSERLPATLRVYKLIPLVESEKDFRDIASQIGLDGEWREGYICIKNESESLTYNPERDTLEYQDIQLSRYPSHIPRVPSKEKCTEIATAYARKAALLPAGARAVATNEMRGTNPDTGSKTHVIKRAVVFGMEIDGYKVRGTGMGLRVYVGDRGKICSFSNNLRKLAAIGDFPVKPIEQALAEAQSGKGVISLENEIENPSVTDLDILYYCDDSNRKASLLMPVYAFIGPDCCIYVPAVNRE